MGVMGIGGAQMKAVTTRKAEGSAGSVRVSNPAKKKLKKLNYNYREISNRLLRTKTSVNAKLVMASAFSKVSVLYRKYRTGQFDDEEVRKAIIHAERIVRVAKKRVKHLQEEERAKKGGLCEAELEEEKEENSPEEMIAAAQENAELSSEELKQMVEELKEAIEEMERESMEELAELTMSLREDMDPEDLEMMKKKHRAKELREIMEADMEYLKALFNRLEKERREGSSSFNDLTSVTLEIAGMEMPTASVSTAASTSAPVAEVVSGGSIDVSI